MKLDLTLVFKSFNFKLLLNYSCKNYRCTVVIDFVLIVRFNRVTVYELHNIIVVQ